MDNNEKAFESYTGTEEFQILLDGNSSRAVLDDWLERNIQSDLKVRRAKTPGHVVIETGDVLFARNVLIWNPSCKSTSKRSDMEKDKVYISGAIAHYNIDERKGAFLDAENRLRAMGFVPVNPFKNGLPDEAHWREHMRADIRLLLDCNFIYMLQGWELSKGAKLELDVASSCGIKYCLNNLLIVNIWKKNRSSGRI
jgi:hypothetical protein